MISLFPRKLKEGWKPLDCVGLFKWTGKPETETFSTIQDGVTWQQGSPGVPTPQGPTPKLLWCHCLSFLLARRLSWYLSPKLWKTKGFLTLNRNSWFWKQKSKTPFLSLHLGRATRRAGQVYVVWIPTEQPPLRPHGSDKRDRPPPSFRCTFRWGKGGESLFAVESLAVAGTSWCSLSMVEVSSQPSKRSDAQLWY